MNTKNIQIKNTKTSQMKIQNNIQPTKQPRIEHKKLYRKMNKHLYMLINHIGKKNIPATNNIVENYYRITLPGKHKRIYRTLKGLIKRIKQQ